MALGATPAHVIGLILSNALQPLAIGLGAGLIASLFLSRMLIGLLYETAPADPIAYFGASAVLLFVGAAASIWPAITASAADPVETLRSE